MHTLNYPQATGGQRTVVRLAMAAGLVVFGIVAAGAVLPLAMMPMLFDSAAAAHQPLIWNLAFAPLAVIAAYVLSLPLAARAVFRAEPGDAWCWLGVQLLGISWVVLACVLPGLSTLPVPHGVGAHLAHGLIGGFAHERLDVACGASLGCR